MVWADTDGGDAGVTKVLISSGVNNYEMCHDVYMPVRSYHYSREIIQKCPGLARNLEHIYALDDWKSGKVYPFFDWDFDEVQVLLYYEKGTTWLKFRTMRGGREVRAVCMVSGVDVKEAVKLLDSVDEYVMTGVCE